MVIFYLLTDVKGKKVNFILFCC